MFRKDLGKEFGMFNQCNISGAQTLRYQCGSGTGISMRLWVLENLKALKYCGVESGD